MERTIRCEAIKKIYSNDENTYCHGGYKRAEFLKKIKYFKSQGEHCYLQPWNYGTEPHMITLGDNVYVTSSETRQGKERVAERIWQFVQGDNNEDLGD